MKALLLLTIRSPSISPNARLLSQAKTTTAPLTKRRRTGQTVHPADSAEPGLDGVAPRGQPLSRPLLCLWLQEALTQLGTSQCQMSQFDLRFHLSGTLRKDWPR